MTMMKCYQILWGGHHRPNETKSVADLGIYRWNATAFNAGWSVSCSCQTNPLGFRGHWRELDLWIAVNDLLSLVIQNSRQHQLARTRQRLRKRRRQINNGRGQNVGDHHIKVANPALLIVFEFRQ